MADTDEEESVLNKREEKDATASSSLALALVIGSCRGVQTPVAGKETGGSASFAHARLECRPLLALSPFPHPSTRKFAGSCIPRIIHATPKTPGPPKEIKRGCRGNAEQQRLTTSR